MGMSDYLENAVIQATLNGVTFPVIPSVFIALYTTPTTDAGGGTEVTTVGTAYVRQELTAGWNVTSPTPETRAENADLIEWALATLAYGVVTHVGIHDAVTGGNLLYHAQLANSQNVFINQIAQIPSGSLAALVGVTPA